MLSYCENEGINSIKNLFIVVISNDFSIEICFDCAVNFLLFIISEIIIPPTF